MISVKILENLRKIPSGAAQSGRGTAPEGYYRETLYLILLLIPNPCKPLGNFSAGFKGLWPAVARTPIIIIPEWTLSVNPGSPIPGWRWKECRSFVSA